MAKSTKQYEIERLEKENERLRKVAFQLLDRHDVALEALSDLAAGLGMKQEHNGLVTLEELARRKLLKIAKMPKGNI